MKKLILLYFISSFNIIIAQDYYKKFFFRTWVPMQAKDQFYGKIPPICNAKKKSLVVINSDNKIFKFSLLDSTFNQIKEADIEIQHYRKDLCYLNWAKGNSHFYILCSTYSGDYSLFEISFDDLSYKRIDGKIEKWLQEPKILVVDRNVYFVAQDKVSNIFVKHDFKNNSIDQKVICELKGGLITGRNFRKVEEIKFDNETIEFACMIWDVKEDISKYSIYIFDPNLSLLRILSLNIAAIAKSDIPLQCEPKIYKSKEDYFVYGLYGKIAHPGFLLYARGVFISKYTSGTQTQSQCVTFDFNQIADENKKRTASNGLAHELIEDNNGYIIISELFDLFNGEYTHYKGLRTNVMSFDKSLKPIEYNSTNPDVYSDLTLIERMTSRNYFNKENIIVITATGGIFKKYWYDKNGKFIKKEETKITFGEDEASISRKFGDNIAHWYGDRYIYYGFMTIKSAKEMSNYYFIRDLPK